MTLLLYLLALPLILVTAGLIYQAVGRFRDSRTFPPLGRLIDVGDGRLHLYDIGEGGPTVILESGIAASSLSWSAVQPLVARFARVCSYDRGGLGWSELPRAPRTCRQLVSELHRLLKEGEVPGPYVLVGHSFGGLMARVYAYQFPDEVAALVLLDPLDPEEWLHPNAEQQRMLRGGIWLSQLGAILATIGFVRLSLTLLSRGRPQGPQLFVKLLGGRAVILLSRIIGEVQKLPRAVLPTVQALWCRPQSFLSMADHLRHLPESSAYALPLRSLGDIPVIVLSANTCGDLRLAHHRSIARLSTRGRHEVAESGHWIHLDQPALVVQAIVEASNRLQK